MRPLPICFFIAATGLLAAQPALAEEGAAGAIQPGHASEVSAGPEKAEIQPSSLAGLWSLSLSGDFCYEDSKDLLSYYPSGALSAPGPRLFPGFSLALRRHISDAFFIGAQMASLPKGYNVSLAGSQDAWQFSGIQLGLSGDWMLYRSVSAGMYVEAQAGWLGLTDGSMDKSSGDRGTLSGSGLSEQFSLGALWFIMPSVALEAQGGWRFAHLPLKLSVKGVDQPPPNGPEVFTELGGPVGRLGLSFFWGLRNPWGESEAPPPPPPPKELMQQP